MFKKKEKKDIFEASTDKIEGKTAKSDEGQTYEGRCRQNKPINVDPPQKICRAHYFMECGTPSGIKSTLIPVCKTQLK